MQCMSDDNSIYNNNDRQQLKLILCHINYNNVISYSHIFIWIWALQGASSVIVQAIGAGIHALEYIR